jgi:carbonic anhydrase
MKYSSFYKTICLVGLQSLAGMALAVTSPIPSNHVMTKTLQQDMTPQQVYQQLQDGNQRFVMGQMKNRSWLTQAHITSTGQHPIAVILNCMDSRTPPEIVFDQGIGDVFAIRIAGNIQNNDILGSMEFGTQLMGAKVIAVIGHTSCGAMKGACQQAQLGDLTALLEKIQPAVNQAAKEQSTKDCKNDAFIDQIAKDNVLLVMKQLQDNSSIIAKQVQDGKIIIVGGVQDLASGKVTWFK